jgi:hypothetical protein
MSGFDDDFEGEGSWGHVDHGNPRIRPRKRKRSDIAGSHALIDSDFDNDDGWKEDIEDLSSVPGM